MTFRVRPTDAAVRDLEEIRDCIDARESPAGADDVPGRIGEAFQGLS